MDHYRFSGRFIFCVTILFSLVSQYFLFLFFFIKKIYECCSLTFLCVFISEAGTSYCESHLEFGESGM